MRLLFDTHLLLWVVLNDPRGAGSRALIENSNNAVVFSVANLWEVAIKRALGRPDFAVDPEWLRGQLLNAGYEELPILAPHALAVATLPPIHRDPFDRLLIAQARTEGMTLLTADARIAAYPGDIRRV